MLTIDMSVMMMSNGLFQSLPLISMFSSLLMNPRIRPSTSEQMQMPQAIVPLLAMSPVSFIVPVPLVVAPWIRLQIVTTIAANTRK